ncbi:hypothetical protein Q7P35_004810 [Cladosporium inversicolor]
MSSTFKTVPTLYTFSGSGNSYKIRLLQALLGIDIKYEELDFLADQQHSPEFLKINPRGEVPALVDGDRTFSDSSSILVWLAEKYDDTGAESYLLPTVGYNMVRVFTNRAIISYNGPYNGLGNNQKWPQSKLDVLPEEGAICGNHSLKILEQRL